MGIDEYSILRKKQKKNAFAATALLISIAIALLVMVGAVLILGKVNDKDRIAPRGDNGSETRSVNNINNGSCEGLNKEIVFNDNLRNIKEAAVSYFTNARLPKETNEKVKITLREMIDKKLILSVRDASANTCDGNKSYVEVTKGSNEYIMKILLSCSDIEDHIIVHLGCYDYCDKDVCEKQEEAVYEYEYKKTTSCTMSDWSAWGAWKTVREKTSNLKKEDIKTETVGKATTYKYDAIANPATYNCNKYGKEYSLSGNKCVKTETIAATKTSDTYNCDKYGKEYKVSGTKCVATGTTRVYETATKNESTYSCPSGYTKTTITYTVKSGDTINSVASANNISVSALKLANNLSSNTISVGQKLTIPAQYQNKCYKDVPKTDNEPAEGITTTTYVNGTCYDNICSSRLVPTCENGYCDMKEIRTCDKVSRDCKKPKQSTTYSCNKYNVNGKVYTITSDNRCIYNYTDREYVNATKNTDTYNCSKYSGYTLSGTQCYKDVPTPIEKPATVVTGKYVCSTKDGYSLTKDNKCTRTITKDAEKNPTTYYCTGDYNLTKDNKCTKVVSTGTKVTYYRYATRTCDGGKTYIKWSLDKNDSSLLNDGYKKTGVKREYKGIIEK